MAAEKFTSIFGGLLLEQGIVEATSNSGSHGPHGCTVLKLL